MAYEQQGISLQYVQKFGPELEKAVREALGWDRGRVIYHQDNRTGLTYDLQVDTVWPDVKAPEVFASVTYCKPDKPGHSNENKLHLKLGELMLLKAEFPEIGALLVVGGNEDSWMSYVLKAFTFFFDKTIFAWQEDFSQAIEAIRDEPTSIALRHADVWSKVSSEWHAKAKELWTDDPINSSLRISIWEQMSEVGYEGDLPKDISSEIFRFCMTSAFKCHKDSRGKNGKEWTYYLNQDWNSLWQCRSYFNPAEAAISLALSKAGFAFCGGLAKDELVPTVINQIPGPETDRSSVSEDFVLYSEEYDMPVFIQSKSTGGGRDGHGKNIQNRAKEQLARSLLYRGTLDGKQQIQILPKDYMWVAVLDGNWGVTKKTPLKYLHMLQWAGYDEMIPADSLVDKDNQLVDEARNPLINLLKKWRCIQDQSIFNEKWNQWRHHRGM